MPSELPILPSILAIFWFFLTIAFSPSVGKTQRAAFGLVIALTFLATFCELGNALVNAIRHASFWLLLAAIPPMILFLMFTVIKAVQILLDRIYGRYVSARIVSAALLQTFAWIGRATGFVLSLPLRLFKRREDMDEMLHDWRRG